MLHSVDIAGYRSLLDFSLKLGPLTIVQGPNGVGKSNLYKALRLFGSLAGRDFPRAMAEEGGTSGCLWAGPVPGPKRPKTVELNLQAVDFSWKVSFGLVPTTPGDPTAFRADPDVKRELLSTTGACHSRSEWAGNIPHNESMLSFIRDAAGHPALAVAREQILSWRFFEGFRSDPASLLRQASPRVWSPVLDHDGANLAAALQTISESSFPNRLTDTLALAFPNHELRIRREPSTLAIEWHLPDLVRPLEATELSDGTIRFLALAAALLSPKPPSLLVLNEPENSLNPSLFPALIKLIGFACEASQVLVITHSKSLAEQLADEHQSSFHQLAMKNGATRLKEDLGSRKVWRFD